MEDDFDDEGWDEEDPPPELTCTCRCGECCKRLLIEVEVEDAEREPKIAERCIPIYMGAELTQSGQRALIGYLLNIKENGYACAFLNRKTNLCTIHDTRPTTCRQFDCDGDGREQLVELGILPGWEEG